MNDLNVPRTSSPVYVSSWAVGGSAVTQFCSEKSIDFPELVTYADIPVNFQKVETLITIEN